MMQHQSFSESEKHDTKSSEKRTGENVITFTEEFVGNKTSEKTWKAVWSRVALYFKSKGFSATLDLNARSIIISTARDETKDQNCLANANRFLQLLTKTNMHPCRALEIMNGMSKYIFAEFGHLRAAAELTDEEFEKRLKRIIDSRKGIYKLTNCRIFVTKWIFTAVGNSKFFLKFVLKLVDICIRMGYHPLHVMSTMVGEKPIPNPMPVEEAALFAGFRPSFVPFNTKLSNGKLEDPENFDPCHNDACLKGVCSFSSSVEEFRVKRLEKDKEMLDSFLNSHNITWTLDPVKRSVTVSTTSEDQSSIDKAINVHDLLARRYMPPSWVIRIIKRRRPHIFMKIGPQKFGLCLNFGIKEEEFRKRLTRLWGSIEAISNLARSGIYYVGPCLGAMSRTIGGLELVRMMVECCIVHNVDPADFIAKIEHKGSNDIVKSLSKREKETVKGSRGRRDEVTSFTVFYVESKEKRLRDAWPMVKLSLKCRGISCKLNMVDRSMTVSTTRKTKDRKSFVRAGRLLRLLGTTTLSPSLALDIMMGQRQQVFMKIGNQEGGLCSIFGIEEDEYREREGRFRASLQEIAELTRTIVFVKGGTVTVVGDAQGSTDRIEMVRTLVEGYIVHGVEHECVSKHALVMKSRKRKGEDNLLPGKSLVKRKLC